MPRRIHPACPSSAFPFRVGGKWTGMIVVLLADGPRRFTELRSRLTGVHPKVLTETLRAMERDGLVLRRSIPANPPHVEYSLTDLGGSLLSLIDVIREWSDQHMDVLLAARGVAPVGDRA